MWQTVMAAIGLMIIGGAPLLARRWLVLVTVTGDSMAPTLRDGDRILVRRRRLGRLRPADIVVLNTPGTLVRTGGGWKLPAGGLNIKRVAALPGDPVPAGVPVPDGSGLVPAGTVVVLSDNPAGVDSRELGPFPAAGLIGTAVRRRPPAERTGS